GGCALALSGGTTPRAVYARLAGWAGIQWPRVDVFFGDERCVPPDAAASNYRMASDVLLSRVPVSPDRIHRMEAERADIDAAARDYDRGLPDRLDVLLLGMGADGHTASLFPDAPALDERLRLVVSTVSPVPPVGRLTITPPVIASARRVVMIVTGAEKARAVERVFEGTLDPRAVPAQLALAGHWFLDRGAASLLGTAYT
ncbi:MAG TPA: 6-phosphogluconolactonase, partial [Gemmatimonadaceae bacterium]